MLRSWELQELVAALTRQGWDAATARSMAERVCRAFDQECAADPRLTCRLIKLADTRGRIVASVPITRITSQKES